MQELKKLIEEELKRINTMIKTFDNDDRYRTYLEGRRDGYRHILSKLKEVNK